MKKRKKKPSLLQQHKLNLAQHKNEFFRRLQSLCCTLGVPQVFKALSDDQLDYFYQMRCQSIRVVASQGCTVADAVMDTAKVVVTHVFRKHKVAVLPDNSIELSLYDFFTVYVTLMLFASNDKFKENPKNRIILDALQKYMEPYEELHNLAATSISNSLTVLNFYASDLRQKIYMHHHHIETVWAGKIGLISLCEIYSDTPEKRNFIIDGVSRPAFRVGWGEYQPEIVFKYVSLTPGQLKINMLTKDHQMPVYIQSHAIQRLTERLDDVITGLIFLHLYSSVNYELSVHRDKNGNILVAMMLRGQKVGYLIADIIDRCVVLRTFLFLTQFGTPEGEKLKTMTGLNKLDSNYFDITKLSTFLESDIPKNEKLKALFIEAGCESLFNLDRNSFADKLEFNEKPRAEKIIEYLGLNRADNEHDDDDDTDDNNTDSTC
jgi:hypothetical protein